MQTTLARIFGTALHNLESGYASRFGDGGCAGTGSGAAGDRADGGEGLRRRGSGEDVIGCR